MVMVMAMLIIAVIIKAIPCNGQELELPVGESVHQSRPLYLAALLLDDEWNMEHGLESTNCEFCNKFSK